MGKKNNYEQKNEGIRADKSDVDVIYGRFKTISPSWEKTWRIFQQNFSLPPGLLVEWQIATTKSGEKE